MSIDTIPCVIGVKNGTITISAPAIFYESLDLEGWYDLSSLPDGLTIFGNLYLIGTRINKLPNDLIVSGNVDLEGCDTLEAIGRGISIGGDLNLEHCSRLRNLPQDLKVKGTIYR